MEISQNVDLEFIKTRAYIARHSYIEDMGNQLPAFEKKLMVKNFKVHWASTQDDLVSMMFGLFPNKLYNRICFDIPKIPENFNNTKVVQKISVAELESGQANANILVTQADFGVVETGSLILLNKNCKNCFNLVSNIFIILDISKLVNKLSELETILYLRSYYQTEKFLPEDVKIINRPFMRIEKSKIVGLDEFESQEVQIHVFLYDNGVTKILSDSKLRNSLYCIGCGKCKSVCPVYHYTKEQSPIDLVKANCFEEERLAGNIFKSTLLCGNCDQVCPVQVPFTDLLINEMQMSRKERKDNNGQAKVFAKRKKLNKMSKGLNRYFFLKKRYGDNRMLHNYFKNQKGAFYNLKWLQEHQENEQ